MEAAWLRPDLGLWQRHLLSHLVGDVDVVVAAELQRHLLAYSCSRGSPYGLQL